jgi:predicted nucleic acid-binding protein
MAGRYFADSFFWIALTHRKDAFHGRVVAWLYANRSAELVTTEEVLAEVLTWVARRGSIARQAAAAVVRTLLTDPAVRVLPQSSAGFHAALTLYESRLDKEYSLVDCRSMLVMRQEGLAEVLSNDRHFAQEGFVVVFP